MILKIAYNRLTIHTSMHTDVGGDYLPVHEAFGGDDVHMHGTT